jgi:RND family efflux transporter MFP subunit
MVQLQTVRLSQTQVRAPDAGVISARQATVGSVVGAGTELFRLIRQSRIEWRAEVTAAEIGRIQVGAAVQIKAASGQLLQGKVRMVAPSVDAQTRNAIVYVDLPAATGSARAGMYAQGDLQLSHRKTVALPLSAVRTDKPQPYVQMLMNNKVAHQTVSVGERGRLATQSNGEQWVAISGLPANSQVLPASVGALREGSPVRLISAAAPASTAKP